MAEHFELRLCSVALASGALEGRSMDLTALVDAFGFSFGRATADHLAGKRSFQSIILAPAGVRFASPDQVVAAVYTASVALADGSSVADDIASFLEGGAEYSESIPPTLAPLGVFAVARHDRSLAFARWLASVRREDLRAAAADIHGRHTVQSITAIVDDLQAVFESVSLHGGDIAAVRIAA